MASLVEAEGGRVSDYPKIARVIYNRLAQDIPLQLDSTVLYGLHTYGIIASDEQLASTSPYNTYKYKGLTPGPIDSPGAAAIQAVLNPAAGNWIYFVTVNPKTGLTLFTASQTQFEQYRAELEHNLGRGLSHARPVPGRGARLADRALPVARAAHGRLRRTRPGRLDLHGDRVRRGRPARPDRLARQCWPGGPTPPRPPREGMAPGGRPPQTPPRGHGPGGRPPQAPPGSHGQACR